MVCHRRGDIAFKAAGGRRQDYAEGRRGVNSVLFGNLMIFGRAHPNLASFRRVLI
jgi:hypothetical protein